MQNKLLGTPNITISFSGNRTLTAPQGIANCDIEGRVRYELSKIIEAQYEQGYRIFLSGGAVGFDMLAAEEVLKVRKIYKNISLILVIPFLNQESKYSDKDKLRYQDILHEASRVIAINQSFSISAYHLRNDFLVNNCTKLIAYSDGRGKGTNSTLRRCKKCGVSVTNIFEILVEDGAKQQLKLDF